MRLPAIRVVCWLCAALLLVGPAAAQERHLHVYTMRHALPDQVLPVLTAQLAPGSSVIPYHGQLVLNVTDSEYATIRKLLKQLDKAPHSLLISVRKRVAASRDKSHLGVRGNIGNDGQQNSVSVSIAHNSAHGSSDGTQRVRTVEGMQAFISTGTTQAVRTGSDGRRELVPVTSGFYATARIVDDGVIVDIDQHDDNARAHDIATQGLHLEVRGAIGQWIPLGSVYRSQAGGQRGISGYNNDSADSLADLAIKVDVLDNNDVSGNNNAPDNR